MSSIQSEPRTLDVVIPVFNEIEIVEQLHTRLVQACENTGLRYRIIYVDDGSADGTKDWLHRFAIQTNAIQTSAIQSIQSNSLSSTNSSSGLAGARQPADLSIVTWAPNQAEPNEYLTPHGSVTLLELSRNFGQPAAILAGLKHSTGDCVVIMDGDLQDPPELISEMVERWQGGDQVVIAQRTGRKETFVRGLAFRAFHATFKYMSDSNIPANTGTFCLLDRVAAVSICDLPESHRFFPGLRAWVGFNQSMVQFKRPPRAGGEPKQTFFRLFAYALDAVFGYSFKPLRILTGMGVAICCMSFMVASWFVFKRMVGWETASVGFTTLTCGIFCLAGIQLVGMGVLGEYIGRIYDEVKRRPQFIVGRQSNSDSIQKSASDTRQDHGFQSQPDSRRLVG